MNAIKLAAAIKKDNHQFTIQETRAVLPRNCTSGIRGWIESNGFNWRDYVQNGLPASELAKLDDHFSKMMLRSYYG